MATYPTMKSLHERRKTIYAFIKTTNEEIDKSKELIKEAKAEIKHLDKILNVPTEKKTTPQPQKPNDAS